MVDNQTDYVYFNKEMNLGNIEHKLFHVTHFNWADIYSCLVTMPTLFITSLKEGLEHQKQ